ncbi:MAG: DegT/DnrJ/EryC1/StrS family aminotransferase [Synergistaceae bacterium]|nr:DegT/DnrJ/EryC1/StrS family aminotransferase [Synergistaceae bacterium]
MKIPITKPFFDERERELILKPLETGWVVQGPYVDEFQNKFSEFTNSKHALATSNCTTALHLSLLALGIGKGDRVVVPSFTFVATANSVEAVGAKPVFCDIDLRTFCMNATELERILSDDKTKTIKAVMPVNQFGLCADLVKIRELADHYGIKMIEDCACSFGSFLDGRHSGTFGHAGCFSFHPRKAITTGEGGMVITDDQEIAARITSLRDHGASKSNRERHGQKGSFFLPDFDTVGYNFRMTDFQGALGVAQMEKAIMLLTSRRSIAARYNSAFKAFPWLTTPFVPENQIPGYQSYICLFANETELEHLSLEKIDSFHQKRNAFMTYLEENGIATRQGTHAVHTLGYYKNTYDLQPEDCFRAYAADRLTVSFPLYHGMTESEFQYIVDTIKAYSTKGA